MNYLLLFISTALLAGCFRIPVSVSPEFDDKGLPVAIPVTSVGKQDLATGEMVPIYPVSDVTPIPPTGVDWESLLQIALGVAGVGGLGYAGVVGRVASKAKKAIGILSQLAEDNGRVETDEEVARNKDMAKQALRRHGVETLVNKVTDKS